MYIHFKHRGQHKAARLLGERERSKQYAVVVIITDDPMSTDYEQPEDRHHKIPI